MMVSLDHPAVRFGYPVILDDFGRPTPHPYGLRQLLARLGWDRRQFAAETGYSPRTVERWIQGGRAVPANALIVLGEALLDRRWMGRRLRPAERARRPTR